MAVTMGRFAKGAILEKAKRIGFRPGAVIDCGYAYGTDRKAALLARERRD